jgi:hypothetical protein
MTRHRRSHGGVRWPSILVIVAACGGGPSTPPADAGLDSPDTSGAQLAGSVAAHDFGFVGVHVGSSPFSYVVTNVGEGPSAPLQLQLESTSSTEFQYTVSQCANSLQPGESCTFELSIYPITIGPKSARFAVTAGTAETSVMLLATSAVGADVDISPSFWEPYAVHVGATPPEATFTVTNVGGITTGDLVASLAGQAPQSFEITTSTCGALAPSATCTIGVAFHPTAAGMRRAQLRVSGSPGGTSISDLTGTATGDTFGITPATYGFGSSFIGLRRVPRTFTVINTGTTTSDPLVTSLGGANPTEFGIESDGCTGVALAPDAICTVGVHYYPTSTGIKSASLRVTTATTGDGTAAVSGQGITGGPVLSPNPSSLAFGNVPIGQPSSVQTITVKNSSFESYSGAIHTSLGGANANQFAIASDGCNLVDLAPNATCTIGVRLQPAQAGALGAVLTIAGGNGARTVALSGSGI